MKILQLTKKFPFPLKDGESIAVTNLGKSLYDLGCEVTLLSMNTKKHYNPNADKTEELTFYKEIKQVFIDNTIKVADAFTNLFSKDSYHISRYQSMSFEKELVKLLKNNTYDIVQLETLYLAPYISVIRKYSKAIVAMRAHNIEHEIWTRISSNTSFHPKRWYLNYLTKKLKNFEIKQFENYDFLVAISDRDLELFQSLGYSNGAFSTPIGIEPEQFDLDFHAYDNQDLSLSFIGSLDWMPNTEGLDWFIENVWKKQDKKLSNVSLHIAGRNTPQNLKDLHLPNFNVHGEVPCSKTFLNEHPVMIVPLFSGSGLRAKIVEAMALGRTVITTNLGLEGIYARDKKEVLIANTADEFIDCIDFCKHNHDEMVQIGTNARQFVEQNFDSLAITARLLDQYKLIKSQGYPK